MSSPPDIFLSYNREDQARAKLFADAFEREGLKVWWDVGLHTGEAYDEVTENALRTAKAVVVLWSKQSVQSRWVRAEATVADRNKTLVPCMIEPCERPIMFELTQTAELSHWQGDATDAAWRSFVADVHRFVQKSVAVAGTEEALLVDLATRQPAGAEAPTALATDRFSIAMMPFSDLTVAKDQAAFLDGLAEELGAILSRHPYLALARGTSRGSLSDIETRARSLGVRYVLDGSVRGSGGRLRVTVRLVATESAAQLWQERFDGDTDDDFALQEQIAAGVATRITRVVQGAEVARAHAFPHEARTAFQCFTLALALSAGWHRTSLEQARSYAEEALRIDPTFSLAHAVLGWIYSVMYQSSWNEDASETMRLGLEHSARALNAAEHDSRVLLMCGAAHISFGRDLSALESMLAKAVAQLPESAELEGLLAWAVLCRGGRPERALELARAALSRDPNSPVVSYFLQAEALSLLVLHRFAEAIPPAREAVMRRPDYLFAEVVLASALAHNGQLEEARALCVAFKGKGRIDIILDVFRDSADRAHLRDGLTLAGLDA